jgi:ATP-dependent HslUV protease ATP-binding subunit HslU
LPIRVELSALKPADFARILTEPDHSLVKQYQALLDVEGVAIEFTEDGIAALADIAFRVNETTENIGARRLHTLMEKLLEDLLFESSVENVQSTIQVDRVYVDAKLSALSQDEDLSRYIL